MGHRLDTAALFERLIDVYRRQFVIFVVAALIVFAPVAVLNGLVLSSRHAGPGLGVAAAGIAVIAATAFEALVVEAVRDIQDGVRDQSLNDLFGAVAPVLLPVLGASILLAIGVAIGFLLLVIPGLVLFTWWALVVPVIVLERPGVLAAFGRSRELVRGNGWRVFGVLVVVILIQSIVSGVLGRIDAGAAGDVIINLAVQALLGPLMAIAATLMYLDLRRIHGEPPVPAGARARY